MSNNVMGFAIFVAGVAIGSAATWYCVKKKYEQIAQEEIDSVKEHFSSPKVAVKLDGKKIAEQVVDIKEDGISDRNPSSIKEYAEKLRKNGYTNYSTADTENKEKEYGDVEKPYVIDPEEFGMCDDYEEISLTYYADSILTDEDDELVDDVEDIIGVDSLNHFGEYEEDSVFVRNDRLKCDYEILLDERKYSDVFKRGHSHQMEE